jgi:hypothetical protein
VLRALDLSSRGVHIPLKRGVDRAKGGERALDWVVSASDRTDRNLGLTPGTTVSHGSVEYTMRVRARRRDDQICNSVVRIVGRRA